MNSPECTPVKQNQLQQVDRILSGSVRSASFNIVFQVLTRIFTFTLNAFILRFVSHDVLGICNVRLALLYSSVVFLSREPFRRACLRKKESDSWKDTVNLIWLVVPNTILWSSLFAWIWCNILTQPEDSGLSVQYRASVWVVALACVIESLAEVPYIIGQYFLFYKLRILADTSLIAVRSGILCFAVMAFPVNAVAAYSIGHLLGVVTVVVMYFGVFHYTLRFKDGKELPFTSILDFLPNIKGNARLPSELWDLVLAFYKQGVLKQLLTEGERYIMTFFDVLSFEEQGIYDLVSNLGSLAARFIFLPIEESAYFYFAQTLQRTKATGEHLSTLHRKDKAAVLTLVEVLSSLVRLMLFIGLVAVVFGIPYSNLVLFLYGGPSISGPGTRLLQANCAYIFVMALNGVTEAFTFAAMTQEQMDKFNKRLVAFSVLFLVSAFGFTKVFGSIGFYMANFINMSLRFAQSVHLIRTVFMDCDVNPFSSWIPKSQILVTFILAFAFINIASMLNIGRLAFFVIGVLSFAVTSFIIFLRDRDLIRFFIRMYKAKTA